MIEPAEYVDTMLCRLRTDFFSRAKPKTFFQQQEDLKLALTHPADWLEKMGGQWATLDLIVRIIETVIKTIKRHGNKAAIERFSVYFLHCVQEHMKHHGDNYLQEAKRMPTVGTFVAGAIQDLKTRAAGVDPVAVLAKTHRALQAGRRRRKDRQFGDSAEDLFSSCTTNATRPQQPEKFLTPLQKRQHSAQSPRTAEHAAGDS